MSSDEEDFVDDVEEEEEEEVTDLSNRYENIFCRKVARRVPLSTRNMGGVLN